MKSFFCCVGWLFLVIPYGILVPSTDAYCFHSSLQELSFIHHGKILGNLGIMLGTVFKQFYKLLEASTVRFSELFCISRLCIACVVSGWVSKPKLFE